MDITRMNEESRWNVENGNALRGLPWDATETGAEASEVSKSHDLKLSICLWRHVGATSQW